MSVTIDIKYAARLLFKKPAFTALTVLIVAVGLGLTLYTYSLLNSLVFKPLVLKGKSPIIALEAEFDHGHLLRRQADPFHLLQVKNQLDLLQDFGLYNDSTTLVGGTNSDQNAQAKMFNSSHTSWNVFEFSGIQPILGRGFSPQDHVEGAEPVVVLGHEVWLDYFGQDANVVGTMVPLDAVATRIIGVMPAGFAFPVNAQIWQPLPQISISPIQPSRNSAFAYARLKKDVSLAQLQNALDSLSKNIIEKLPEDLAWREAAAGGYLSAVPFKKANIIQYYPIFIAMFVVVFLILMLACINVGNLLLARVNERIKEIAIRVALGVPRKRLILQMLWESIFICSVGGFLAVLFAGWGLDVSNAVLEQTYAVNNLKPFWWQLALDGEAVLVLIFAILAMILITGFIPAWRALSGDFNAVLRDGTRGALGKRAAKASKLLVISEVLLSCVVLVMATIILSTSYSAAEADYGVDTQDRLTARLQLPATHYNVRNDTEYEEADRLKRSAFYYKLKNQLESQPHIEAVAFMTSLPGTGEGTSYFEIEGKAARLYNENPYSNNEVVAKGSWAAVGMSMLHGRDFDHRDIGINVNHIIVNQSIANDFFPDGDAVGQRIRHVNRSDQGNWRTIIGVVSDTFHGSAMSSSSAAYNAYHLMDSNGRSQIDLAIHYVGKQAAAKQSLLQAVNAIDADVGVYHIQSYDDLIKQPMMLVMAVSKIFLLCGMVAVFLAASGIYAVAANSITQRTQEIGVRRALGASDSSIMSLFVNQAIKQLSIGLTMGIIISLLLVNYMSQTMILNNYSYIIGLLGVPLLIIIMVLLATYIPTRKVVLMEPSDALHYD
jgi:putative ABC transport system permease protein